MTKKHFIKNSTEIQEAIRQLAAAIIDDFWQPGSCIDFALIGIQVHGVSLARRLAEEIEQQCDCRPAVGTLDITMYRDDIGIRRMLPAIRETEINFDINHCNVILVDDVLSSGRTIRAALDAINDYGRPAKIKLAVLVDRGIREYPIIADYCGMRLQAAEDEKIVVQLESANHEAIFTVNWKDYTADGKV